MWTSGNFHRASSAGEGRNGCLSQSYHTGRGLTKDRLTALTAIHNYDTRRDDGSTTAERLFNAPFPDLFEWLIAQIDTLPLPRKVRQRVLFPYLDEAAYLTLARLRVAEGSLGVAEALLLRLHQVAASTGRSGSLIEILILHTVTYAAQKQPEKAIPVLAFGKLGVESRTQAIARGRELGLIAS